MLEQMRIHRHIPLLCERSQRADVVEMSMRQHDALGWRLETLFRSRDDERGRPVNAGINQHPIARAGYADEHDVHEREPPVCDVRSDLVRAVITQRVGFRIIGARGGIDGNLIFIRHIR